MERNDEILIDVLSVVSKFNTWALLALMMWQYFATKRVKTIIKSEEIEGYYSHSLTAKEFSRKVRNPQRRKNPFVGFIDITTSAFSELRFIPIEKYSRFNLEDGELNCEWTT